MNYTEKELVEFGNYVLSEERKTSIEHEQNLNQVTDADLANFKDNNPKKAFGMTFGAAMESAKKGYKIAREGWNGSEMYAVIMPGYPEGIPANAETAKTHNIPEGTFLKFRPYWQLKTAQKDIAMWAPSGSDSLSEDWLIVD